MAFTMRQTRVLSSYFPLNATVLLPAFFKTQFFNITVLHYQWLESGWFWRCLSAVWLDLRCLHLQLTKDSNIQQTVWLDCHLPQLKSHVIPLTTDWHPQPLFLRQMQSTPWCSVLRSQFRKKLLKQYGTW